jgi:hypothetical protein
MPTETFSRINSESVTACWYADDCQEYEFEVENSDGTRRNFSVKTIDEAKSVFEKLDEEGSTHYDDALERMEHHAQALRDAEEEQDHWDDVDYRETQEEARSAWLAS